MTNSVVKKVLAAIVIMTVIFSFTGCGKSDEVINVENSISSLTAESDYKTVNDTYLLYAALSTDDKEKVENSGVLAGYINLSDGHYILTEDMLAEIEEYYEHDDKFARAKIALDKELSFVKQAYDYAKDWNGIGEYEWASSEAETDDYAYTRYGTVEVIDKYGNSSVHNFELNSYAIYDEAEGTYKMVHSAEIEK